MTPTATELEEEAEEEVTAPSPLPAGLEVNRIASIGTVDGRMVARNRSVSSNTPNHSSPTLSVKPRIGIFRVSSRTVISVT